MTTRLTRLATGLIGVALTLLLVVGPPWLLTSFVGPPVPASWPDLDLLRGIATVGVTDTFVVTTLAVVVWIAWGQLATAIVIETLAAIRRRPSLRLPLLPGTQPLAARLVAATLLLVTVLQPRPLAAAAPLELAVATAPAVIDDEQHLIQPSPPARTATHTSTQTIVVGDRDSWWSLAETHLGDGLRWREIRDLNLDRTLADRTSVRASTEQVQPGWDLLVPAVGATPGQDEPPSAGHSRQTPEQRDVPAEWTVAEGQHFWGMAEDTLAQAWGRPPTDHEVVAYWRQLIGVNRGRLAPPYDPDLLYPGQQLVVPDPPPDPTVDQRVPPDPDTGPEDATSPLDSAPPPSTPETADPPPAPTDPTDPARSAEDREPAGPDATGRLVPDHLDLSSAPPPTAPADDGPTADQTAGHTALQIPAGLHGGTAAAALAAAGVIALLGRRRRAALQQRTPGMRLPTPAPELVDHLGSLTAAAPPDIVLDELVDLLATIPPDAAPALVLIHDRGPISLVFDQLDTQPPPPPWQADNTDGGPPRWTATLGTRGPRRSIGLPLLLTAGRTPTATVLANLTAIGTLPVTGPTEQVTDRLRAAALELACSRTAGPLEVTVVGDPAVPDVEQLRSADDPSPAVTAALADAEEGIIADDRLPCIIICHDPARQPDLPAEVAGHCALLTAATDTPPGWRLELESTRTWLHTPDSGRHELHGPDLRPQLIDDELDRLQLDNTTVDRPETATPAPASDPDTATTAPASDPGTDPTGDAEAEPDGEPFCEVGLLGPLTITRDGQPLAGLTPTVRQLLPYLATHRHGITLDRLDDAIWPGRPASRHGQRARTALTRLRQSLGDGPDGQPLIARREHGEQPVTISKHVTTDIDRALHHLEHAKTGDIDHELQHLLAALALIRGEPFEDLPYPWALEIQQHAITHLHDAALAAAGLLRQAGRYEDAEHAIRQGLALYDPSEPLYVAWFHLEHARGRPDRIPHLWRRLQQRYADQADETAGTITTPTIETELAFTTLTQRGPR